MLGVRWYWGVLSVILVIGIGVGLGYGWWWWQVREAKRTLRTPLTRSGYVRWLGEPSRNDPALVLGYLPYWTMNSASLSGRLTDVAYFNVALGANGTILERSDGGRDPGFSRLQTADFAEWMSEQHAAKRRVHLTITGGSADDISALVSNQVARAKAREQIVQLVASLPFDGVQMDIEYAGTVTDGVRDGYAQLVATIAQGVKELNPDTIVTVATFASAASRYTFWDIGKLSEHIDAFIVMTYDYHLRSSVVTGPVAPIFGKQAGRWEDDVVSNIRTYLQTVPPEKILLGIPFYGYEWTATSDQPGAATYPDSGATATYKRVQEILNDPTLDAQERWDEDALSPYIVYKEQGKTQVVYYENTRSLGYKLDLVNQLGLRGVAVWALGYEGSYEELWDIMSQKLPVP